MSQLVIAAQLYTVRELLKDKSEKEIKNVLTKIRDIGYKAIQISGVGEITPELGEQYKNIALELKLDICASHFSFDYLEENTNWIIKLHKIWDCTYVGIGSMPREYNNMEGLKSFAKRCNTLGEKLKEEGVQLIYHNHKFEFEKFEGKSGLDILLDLFDPNYVQLELDVYWVQAGGANPVSWIKKVSGNMGVMHFKDMRIVNDKQEFAEIGQGNLEWPLIIDEAKKSNVKYAAVEQDSFTKDPIRSLEISYEFLKKLMI